jgi:hypothetical protein
MYIYGYTNVFRTIYTSSTPPVDPDAQAFITAAAITDPTQQSAVNQLVVDLKGYGVWTKMKALYPFVGGTASQHKFNLKDPRDLDAAFRMVFNGGWTHSANGILPNGTNAYADTFFNPVTQSIAQNNFFLSAYSRTNSILGVPYEIGNSDTWFSGAKFTGLITRYTNGNRYISIADAYSTVNAETDSRAFYCGGTNGTSNQRLYKNGVSVLSGTSQQTGFSNCNMFIGAVNSLLTIPSTAGFSNKELAFASLSTGLTDTEASNFYTAVQTFQTTLGRSIGTQTVSDADAQAFVTNAGIVDQVEANAVNNLVIGMKADGIWSKMKAIYPFVGGTASQHKFNLKNPLDTDAAFRLVFNGGVTHSSNGYQPNGTNGYADTKVNENSVLSLNNQHLSIYSRTNVDGLFCDIGVNTGVSQESNIFAKYLNTFYPRIQNTNNGIANTGTSQGLFVSNRTNSTQVRAFQNGVLKLITNNSLSKSSANIFIGASSIPTGANLYSPRQYAFASIGDGLTDTEATNLNTRVTTFQTALNRNI